MEIDPSTKFKLIAKKNGMTVTRIADECGVSRGWIYKVVKGDQKSAPVRAKIIELLGPEAAEVFGDA